MLNDRDPRTASGAGAVGHRLVADDTAWDHRVAESGQSADARLPTAAVRVGAQRG